MTYIQIIDDDLWCGEAVIAFLWDAAPGARFEVRTSPNPDDGRDIYIVDNEFGERDHGLDLVERIRSRNPEALIILCTGTHVRVNLHRAMNAGCNALIEKGCPEGRDELYRLVRRYFELRTRSASSPTLVRVLSDVKSILCTWNTRMRQEATGAGV